MHSRFVVVVAVMLVAFVVACEDTPAATTETVFASPVGSPTASPFDDVETHPLTMILPEIPFRVGMEPTVAVPAREFQFEGRTDSFPVGGGRPLVEIKWNAPLPVASAEQQSLANLLSRIPDTPENRQGQLHLSNLALWRRLLDLEVPSYEDGKGAYLDRLRVAIESRSSAAPSPWNHGPGEVPSYFELNDHSEQLNTFDNLGFDRRNVDQTAMNLRGSESEEVIQGRFDLGLAKMLLAECDCPQPDAIVSYGGYEYWSWDERPGDQRYYSPPVFDSNGRGGHLLITEFGLFRAFSVLRMEQLIDTLAGVHPALAASDDYAFMADVMSANDANGVQVHTGDLFSRVEVLPDGEGVKSQSRVSLGPVDTVSLESNRANALLAPLLLPYRFVAKGFGSSDAEPFALFVIANNSPGAAAVNAHRLADRIVHSNSDDGLPWAVLFQSVEISVSGNNVVARFTGTHINRFSGSYYPEMLFAHEG